MKKLLKNESFQAIISSLFCVVVGLLVGYIVLLIINPSGANEGIVAIVSNFMNYSRSSSQLKYFGNTLVKTVPLIMCSLSILFAYKAGLFNIGVAGQYTVGICASLYGAIALGLPWYLCILIAVVVGSLWGALVGVLKTYCNVNEVISGIMLNWIGLYMTNSILMTIKEETSPYTMNLSTVNEGAIISSFGLDKLFNGNEYITIAIPIVILIAIMVKITLDKTRFGYELKATGFNAHAAQYAGMAQKKNVILTLMIAGGIAGAGASLFYLTGFEQYMVTMSSVPAMGFNGIAAAFLGGLSPIGCIFSSFFIQHISNGGAFVDKTMYSAQISDLIAAVIIYLCGFVFFIKVMINNYLNKSDKKGDKA